MLKLISGLLLILCFNLITALDTYANDQPATKHLISTSGPNRLQMLELYSSESCSSCPPADEWVATLKDNPELWKTFVPVVFHVDYWNYLDWKDELSTHQMTQRQIDLSNKWSHASVYTPGFILNGKEFKNWRQKVIPQIQKDESYNLSVYETAKNEFSIEILRPLKLSKNLVVRMAVLGFGLESNITSGENKGRNLHHDFVVLDWQSKKPTLDSNVTFRFTQPTQKYKKLAAVVWVEDPASPEPLQVAGGYL